ncbi:m7GpppX diphosphatase [Cloeon dipterum]|uniref:m7GpppX diphosphatase n=1 Tax=Cloeon dipterum TaxID=197152 RepID=UPI0032206F88
MEPKATETEAGVSTQETSVSVPETAETFDFTKFSVQKVLNEDCRSKVIFLQGKFEEKEGDTVVILEKQVFNSEKIQGIFTACTAAKTKENDIYYKFVGQPNNEDFTGVKIDVVHPATTKHIEKYLKKKIFLVEETPELYRNVVLPYLKECGFSLQWVYNILERKAEVEKIEFEDVDPKIGFTLVHDDKWDGVTVDNLHLLAISRDREIRSLRDLRGAHIALLENIQQNASETIEKKFNLPRNRQVAYFHYRPSFEHLHVHIKVIEFEAPGTHVGRAHLLSDVIANLKASSDYYAKSTLGYTLSEASSLASALNLC